MRTHAVGFLLATFAIAAFQIGPVNAQPTKVPDVPGAGKTDKKTMDGSENRGNNAGRNENTKPVAKAKSEKSKAAKSKSEKSKPAKPSPKADPK